MLGPLGDTVSGFFEDFHISFLCEELRVLIRDGMCYFAVVSFFSAASVSRGANHARLVNNILRKTL